MSGETKIEVDLGRGTRDSMAPMSEISISGLITRMVCASVGSKFSEIFPDRESIESATVELVVNGHRLSVRESLQEYLDFLRGAEEEMEERARVRACAILADTAAEMLGAAERGLRERGE